MLLVLTRAAVVNTVLVSAGVLLPLRLLVHGVLHRNMQLPGLVALVLVLPLLVLLLWTLLLGLLYCRLGYSIGTAVSHYRNNSNSGRQDPSPNLFKTKTE